MFTVFLSYGFRPFFFGASLYATVIIPLWIANYVGLLAFEIPSPASSWHVHEMIFGFVSAAAAGFILTAMPNWTRTKPLQGGKLGLLFSLWLAGRISMFIYDVLPFGLSAVIDVSFLIILTVYTGIQLIASKNYKNLIICAIFANLAVANICMHLEFLDVLTQSAVIGQKWAVDTVLLLIVVLGGRVVPAFTQNWLKSNGQEAVIPTNTLIDKLAMLSVFVLLIINIMMPNSFLSALIGMIAGAFNIYRLSRWQGFKTIAHPLLWVLHLGYLWLCVSLFLSATSYFASGIPVSLGLHAAGIGAAGTMIGAIMTRASLGHTGRALFAPRGIALGYIFISLSTIVRIIAEVEILIDFEMMLYTASLMWVAGFGLITIVYSPILLGPNKKQ